MNVQIAEPQTLPPAAGPALPDGLKRVVLTGFMGAGKTTVGRMLAAQLGWEFLDLDASIEQRTGLTVPAIFAESGEACFRRVESTALVSALGRRRIVLALGGGTPELLTNRLLIEQTPGTTTVLLDAPFPRLFDRCVLEAIATKAGPSSTGLLRPLLSDPAAAERRFLARQPFYRRLARATVQTADLSPRQTADAVLASLAPAFSGITQ